MHKKLCFILIAVMAMVSALVACGQPATPVAEGKPPAQPTATPGIGQPGEPAKEWAYDGSNGLDRLGSYRLKSVTTLHQEGEEPSVIEMLVAYDRANAAQHMVIKERDPSTSQEITDTWEMIRIGQDSYAKVGGNPWLAMQTPDEEFFSPVSLLIYRPENLLQSARGAYQAQATVNGLATEHYVYNQEALAQTGLFEAVVEAEGEVWVATEHNVAVRAIIHIKGRDAESGLMTTITVQSDITDINQKIDIQPPAGVEKAQAPQDIPLYPGATDVISMMGMTRFEVAATVKEVTDFYRAEMPNHGWKQAEALAPGFLTYTKPGQVANIAIQAQGDKTGVAIVLQTD